MIGLLQRVERASVTVGGQRVASIGSGLLVLIGVVRDDDDGDATRLAERLAHYRVFGDAQGKMNLSVIDTGGSVLAVPQFTLAADTGRGRRPSFGRAADPERGKRLFDDLCDGLSGYGLTVATGEFGANMQVELVNDGPVTFWLSTR